MPINVPLLPAVVKLLAIAALAVAATIPPHLSAVSGGGTLAAPGGMPVFPSLAGRPVVGLHTAFGGWPMEAAWAGYRERQPLGISHEALVLRAYGSLAVYAVRRGEQACVGELRFEPRALPDPSGAERKLRAAGFQVRRGFLATSGATFAIDAGFFERRARGWVERYVLVREEAPHGTEPPQRLAEAAWYPAALEGGLEAWTTEGRRGLAEHFASRVRR